VLEWRPVDFAAPEQLIARATIGSATLLTAPTYGRTVALP